MKRVLLVSLTLIIVFSLSFVLAEESGLVDQQNIQRIIDRFLASPNGRMILSGFVFALFSLDIILPVPSSLVMLSASSVLGGLPAFFICLAGLCASGALAYEVCRKDQLTRLFLGQDEDKSQQHWIPPLQKHGFWIVVITRPIPMMTELFSCLAGVAKMSRWSYYSASVLANVAFAFTYTLLPTALGLRDDHWPFTIGFGLPAIWMGIWWLGVKTWGNDPLSNIEGTRSSSNRT